MFIDYLKVVWKAKKFRDTLKSIQIEVRRFPASLIRFTSHITL